jgi:hypothetical protein
MYISPVHVDSVCMDGQTNLRNLISSPRDFEPGLNSATMKPNTRGYNLATLFLGEINTGTWPYRFGESQK